MKLQERELIDTICGRIPKRDERIVVGAGEDDCAVMDVGGRYLVLTTDMLHRSTDFPEEMSPYQMGWSVVSVNLSDIASMGAEPFVFTVAMGFPDNTEIKFVEEIMDGMEACSSKYGVTIVGGDVDKHDELTLVGTALGFVEKKKLIRRKGARVGDLVCVTGSLGNAALGMKIIEENLKVEKKLRERMLKALFEPEPRVKEGIILAESGSVTSMIDISDGLSVSLHELGKASEVGFLIYDEELPVFEEVRSLTGDGYLYYGGDYELLFTVREWNKDMGIDAKVIGKVIEKGIFIKKGEEIRELKPEGYSHF
ncbi:MAG: thiamine-phosphate kinase [Candidatus Syntropharchaeia archaeon]